MKTLKTLFVAVLVVFSMSAFATNDDNAEKLNMNYTLKMYIDAFAHGKIKGFAEVLDKEVRFSMPRNEKILSFTKTEVLGLLKRTANIEQNCSTTANVIEQNRNQAVVKITMKYDNFSKVSFVSMTNTPTGWKITNVSSSFN